MEWTVFIGLMTASGWFASGGLQQFFSGKTSFSQYKGKVFHYPVVSITIYRPTSEVNLSDVEIKYKASGMAAFEYLKMGENHLHNQDKYNGETEKVIFQSLENKFGTRSFRIIHATPILEKNLAKVDIQIEYNVENKTSSNWWSNLVFVYITSLENSPGLTLYKWKDGKAMQIAIDKNTFLTYTIQPQMTKYLEETDECQKESYYECIASQLDVMEFSECSDKCIPNAFSILGKNYNTPFCQNDTDSERCAIKIIEQITVSDCKKSCSNLEYFGEFMLNIPFSSDKGKNWNMHYLRYRMANQDFESMVYEEYYIYDTVGMIGSVGGTFGTYLNWISLKNVDVEFLTTFCFVLGMFIGFSLTGMFSLIFSYLRRCSQTRELLSSV